MKYIPRFGIELEGGSSRMGLAGFVIIERGIIKTGFHVVEGGTSVFELSHSRRNPSPRGEDGHVDRTRRGRGYITTIHLYIACGKVVGGHVFQQEIVQGRRYMETVGQQLEPVILNGVTIPMHFPFGIEQLFSPLWVRRFVEEGKHDAGSIEQRIPAMAVKLVRRTEISILGNRQAHSPHDVQGIVRHFFAVSRPILLQPVSGQMRTR